MRRARPYTFPPPHVTLLSALERPRNEAPYPSYLPGIFSPLRCLRRPYKAHLAEALPGPVLPARGSPTGEDGLAPPGRNESAPQISVFQNTRSYISRPRKHGAFFPSSNCIPRGQHVNTQTNLFKTPLIGLQDFTHIDPPPFSHFRGISTFSRPVGTPFSPATPHFQHQNTQSNPFQP